MKKFIIIISLLSLISCEKMILGEDAENTPENNFELFWNDLDQHYGLFHARDFDWDSIYSVYRPQVNSNTTDQELWSYFKGMTAYLDDGHTFIDDNAGTYFSSGSENNYQIQLEFNRDLVRHNYLEVQTQSYNYNYFYGEISDKKIGYIYLADMDFEPSFIDEALEHIGHHKAIIIDVRNNNGGYIDVQKETAGRFSDGEHFIYTVQERSGPNYDDFSPKKRIYTAKCGKKHFAKPVVVLTDQKTISSGELFLLNMRSFDNVTIIGDTTSGDFSNISTRRFLPNGWEYQYSIYMVLLPDGSSLDGKGIVPDIYVRNSISDLQNGNDIVLERGLQFLHETYEI